mmetsp:Transcript_20973/g.32938  ORF Transcript_20973/g.32938 Transcript_20973/m.32938 type:complete len:224 (-) Transcript_20973:490-1161(-)
MCNVPMLKNESFHTSRSFNSSKIKDISILASNPKEVDGLIIMSINKSNGDVRGFMRRESTGHMHQITSMENEDDDDSDADNDDDAATDNGIHNERNGRRLRLKKMERSLGEDGFAAKNWTCGSAHAHDDDDPLRWREHGSVYGDEDDLRDHHHHHHHRCHFCLSLRRTIFRRIYNIVLRQRIRMYRNRKHNGRINRTMLISLLFRCLSLHRESFHLIEDVPSV